MTLHQHTDDLDRIFSEVGQTKPASHRPLIIRACLLLAGLIVVAAVLVYWTLHQREREVLRGLSQRSEILASTRAEVLKTWLDSLGSSGLRLSHSDVFRLFATETGLNGNLPMKTPSLAAQVPYMMQVITQFAHQEGMLGVYLVDAKGRAILSSAGAPDLITEQRQAAVKVFASKTRAMTPVRQYADGLALDVLLPVAPPQEENPAAPSRVSGVFILTVPVQTALAEKLKASPLAQNGEETRLFQVIGGTIEELAPDGRPVLKKLTGVSLPLGKPLSFAKRSRLGGTTPVFSYGTWVPDMPWLVVQETNTNTATAPLRTYSWGVIALAILAILLITSAFVSFWWRQESAHNQALVSQYRDLGSRIAAQRRFLGSLMNTVTEMIGLKRKDGPYTYANPSFAHAVGRSPKEIEGLDDGEIFGRGTAERLQQSDKRTLTASSPVTVEEVVHLRDGPHELQISKVPYRDEKGEISGILTVSRDVTEIREAERRRQRGLQGMTRAFIRTIEQVDPYLSGHSQNVREIGVAIAKRLDLSSDEVTTIDIAAMLAQIGKLSVPKEIVSKKERLNPAEINIMQGHVSSAVSLLREVDFGLPVVETIQQMYERLDGQGYPEGLSGDQIRLPARVLAVADVFAARIEPRSYRDAISIDEALGILKDHPERYDALVVGALSAFLESIEGEKLVAAVQGR